MQLRVPAGAVVLDRLVPAPLRVVVDAEVAESGAANAVQAVLLADRDRAVEQGDGVGLPEIGMGEAGHEERIREQLREAGPLGDVGRGRRVRDRVRIDGAAVRHARQADLDRREHLEPHAFDRLVAHESSCFGVGLHRLVVAPLAVEAVRDPGDDPRAIERLLERVACLGVRVEGGLEGAEALAHVAERLEHPCTVAHVDALEVGSCECPLVELGRYDVGEARRRTVGGCHRVAPCALAVLRLEEVERENRRLLVGATGCVPLEREPDAAVDVASAPVREAGVGGLAQRDRAGRRARRRPACCTNSASASHRSGSPASGTSSARISPTRSSRNTGPTTAA